MVSGTVNCPTTGISIHWESNPETVFSRAGTGGSTGTSSEVPLEPEMLGPLGIRCWRSLSPLPCVYGVKESRGTAALDVGHICTVLRNLVESIGNHRCLRYAGCNHSLPSLRGAFGLWDDFIQLKWLEAGLNQCIFLKYTHRKGFYIIGP
jgi:hypothetical protein